MTPDIPYVRRLIAERKAQLQHEREERNRLAHETFVRIALQGDASGVLMSFADASRQLDRYARGTICPHGQTVGERYAGPAMAAPYTVCDCCLQLQFYVDMAVWTDAGEDYSRNWSQGACEACGGHYEERGRSPFQAASEAMAST